MSLVVSTTCAIEMLPGSRNEDDMAMRILALFFPWVNDVQDSSDAVPYIADLWPSDARSWREALCMQVNRRGYPTQDRVRPNRVNNIALCASVASARSPGGGEALCSRFLLHLLPTSRVSAD